MANDAEEADRLAALYALEQLDGDEQASFEAELRRDAGLRDRLRKYRKVTDGLALAAPRQTPPPQLRRRLLSELDGQRQTRSALSQGSHLLVADSLPWLDTPLSGVSIKPLNVDRQRRTLTLLVRMTPGAVIPGHRHALGEELFMLAGEARIGDHEVQVGDYARSDPGSEHPPTHSDQGCTFLAVTSLDDSYCLAGDWHSLEILAALA